MVEYDWWTRELAELRLGDRRLVEQPLSPEEITAWDQRCAQMIEEDMAQVPARPKGYRKDWYERQLAVVQNDRIMAWPRPQRLQFYRYVKTEGALAADRSGLRAPGRHGCQGPGAGAPLGQNDA